MQYVIVETLTYRDYILCIICLFYAKMRRIMKFFSANVWIVGGIVVILQPKYRGL